MKFKVKEIVRGFQNMEYQIDGKAVFTKVVFIDTALNPEAGGKGYRTRDMKCVSPEVIRSVEHNPFPLECELEIEELATKNKSELYIHSITPLKPILPQTQAKAVA